MFYRDFQGMNLSVLGFGAMRLPVPDEEAALRMVDTAMQNGINYYDTAWGYHGESFEPVMGRALARYTRESWYIAAKFPGFDPRNRGKVRKNVERLRELRGGMSPADQEPGDHGGLRGKAVKTGERIMKRKRWLAIPALLAPVLLLSACSADPEGPAIAEKDEPALTETAETAENTEIIPEENGERKEKEAREETMIYAHIGERTLTIRPENNSSAEAFAALLAEGDITVDMHDYGGFEKVGPLGASLVTNDTRITTEPGDVILYQGNQITIYYDVNTWSFTRLGRVQDLTADELRKALGDGDPTVVFSLSRERPAK